MHLLSFLAISILLSQHGLSGKIKVSNPNDIKDKNHIDMYIASYPVIVASESPAIEMFDESLRPLLYSMIKPGIASMPHSEPRGLPPNNWAKFKDTNGHEMAIFSYKSLHHCSQKDLEGSRVVDVVSMYKFKTAFKDEPHFFHARSTVARKMNIHTVTTEALEMYIVQKSYSSITSLSTAHSDIRVIPFTTDAHCFYERDPILKKTKYVLTGSVHKKDWIEGMFMALMDENFSVLRSWILTEPNNAVAKTQKNWLPFWDKCKLMLSKRFAPQHVVSEFVHLRSKDEMVSIPDTISSLSPADVPNDLMVRGSAPVVVHPRLEPGLAIGCVHIRGRLKVYRHSLYIMETAYPYRILSYSPLFSFKPYRNIEFVMSLTVTDNFDLELTHGSSDCEPRLAIYNWTVINMVFKEYIRRSN